MLRKTVLSLESPTGAFIAPLRCANANLFNKVQEKLAKNKKAPARHKAEESYLLTTKLYCGKCGALMFGESGVSHTGKIQMFERDIVRAKQNHTSMVEMGMWPVPITAELEQVVAAYHGKTHTLFVYGTLMQGQPAHDLLKDSIYSRRYTLHDHTMVDLQSASQNWTI